MTTSISPRQTIMAPPSAPLGRTPRAKRVVVPMAQPPEYTQSQPGCFATAFNSLFEQVMTKLFGRDG